MIFTVDVPKPLLMGNEGFDLNSVGEFSGWGDLNPGGNNEMDSYSGNNQRTDNRRGRGFGKIFNSTGFQYLLIPELM